MMQADQITQITNNQLFLLLARKRKQAKIIMVALTMLIFLSIHICWAFIPAFVNLRVPEGSAVSLGVWFTVAMILTAIVLSGYYSLVSGKKLDALNRQLIKELNHEQQ